MNEPRTNDLQRRGYTDEEVSLLYEFGRFSLENGESRRAEIIFSGLTEAVPEFSSAHLGLCAVYHQNGDYESALSVARQAVKVDPESPRAMLYLVCCLLTTGDMNAAGSYLGEIGDQIETGGIDDPILLKFYKAQLARYQNRA
jgi:Flp pilus assembly protein TadD